MALLGSDSEIGPNSMQMFPMEEQQFDDYCAGEILIAAEQARSDYQCTTASPESFASMGPSIQTEVSQSVAQAQSNTQSQSSITQDAIDELSSPVISDEQIRSAPNAVTVGSVNAASPFTARQLDAAQHTPINWPATLTIQASMNRTEQWKRSQAAARRHMPQTRPARQLDQMVPNSGWGAPVGASKGWCGLSGSPWGKLLLFTGLGLIAASLLERK